MATQGIPGLKGFENKGVHILRAEPRNRIIQGDIGRRQYFHPLPVDTIGIHIFGESHAGSPTGTAHTGSTARTTHPGRSTGATHPGRSACTAHPGRSTGATHPGRSTGATHSWDATSAPGASHTARTAQARVTARTTTPGNTARAAHAETQWVIVGLVTTCSEDNQTG